MPVPLRGGDLTGAVLHDEEANPIASVLAGGLRRLAVDAIIGGPIVIGGVELDDGGGGTTRAQIHEDGTAFNVSPNQGSLLIAAQDDAGPTHRNLRATPAGHLIVSVGASTPGATITTPADTAVGIGATVALPAIPAGTSRMTVQNTGGAGTFLRVREVGAGAARGVILPRFGSVSYGGEDGAIAVLEVEEVIGGIATSAMIQFEGP